MKVVHCSGSPVSKPFAIFALGVFVQACGRNRLGLRRASVRLIPLMVAGVGAAAVIGLWVLTRRDTITSLLSTVYPGQRLEATVRLGHAGMTEGWLRSLDEALAKDELVKVRFTDPEVDRKVIAP